MSRSSDLSAAPGARARSRRARPTLSSSYRDRPAASRAVRHRPAASRPVRNRSALGIRRLGASVRWLVLVVSCLATVSATLAWTAASPAATVPRREAPVVAISARVVDIVVSTADPEREVRVDRSRDSVRVTLDATVLFGKDSAAIRSSSATRLSGVAAELRRRGAGRVRIVGYTDDLGSAAHGRALSRRRAQAVAAALRSELPAVTYAFTVTGRGEAEPAVPNTSEANRRINRRVVVTYLAD